MEPLQTPNEGITACIRYALEKLHVPDSVHRPTSTRIF